MIDCIHELAYDHVSVFKMTTSVPYRFVLIHYFESHIVGSFFGCFGCHGHEEISCS